MATFITGTNDMKGTRGRGVNLSVIKNGPEILLDLMFDSGERKCEATSKYSSKHRQIQSEMSLIVDKR